MKIVHKWDPRRVLHEDDKETLGESVINAVALGASLDGASLDGASLDGASLVNASLVNASLVNASLVNASLDGASLDGASLDGASLDGASLDGASLDGASLRSADLLRIKDDLFSVLDAAAAEVPALLAELQAGRINGTKYEGDCKCLKGTIAGARGVNYRELTGPLAPDVNTPAEAWFLAIRKGDTPDNSQVSSITEEWIKEWQAAHATAPADPGVTPTSPAAP